VQFSCEHQKGVDSKLDKTVAKTWETLVIL